MSETKTKWQNVGTLRKNKDGKLYLKFDQEVTLAKGAVLQLQKPDEAVKRLMELGYLDEEKGATRLAAIPEYVKYNVVLPPPMKKG